MFAFDRARLPTMALAVLLGTAAVEVTGHAVVQSRVVSADDWTKAAERVSSEWRPGDIVQSAPLWTDPLLRLVLGDKMTLPMAAASDTVGYKRLWALTIRGFDPAHLSAAKKDKPEYDERIGPVRVRRWRLPNTNVVYDFREHLNDATVALTQDGEERGCTFRRGQARGAGLSVGPAVPRERFECDPRRSWLWVGRTINEDLDLLPRDCIWQHPAGREPVSATFHDVPIRGRLRLEASLFSEHERMREGGPVKLRALVNGEEVGVLVHQDGNGWQSIDIDPREAGFSGASADVRFETSADVPHLRTICWAARLIEGEL